MGRVRSATIMYAQADAPGVGGDAGGAAGGGVETGGIVEARRRSGSELEGKRSKLEAEGFSTRVFVVCALLRSCWL